MEFFVKHAENQGTLEKLKKMSPYNDPIAPNFLMKHAWALYAQDFPLVNLGGHFPSGGNYKQIEHFR